MVRKSWLNGLRRCPVQGKAVFCDGLCSVVYGPADGAVGAGASVLCPELLEKLDLALNGESVES